MNYLWMGWYPDQHLKTSSLPAKTNTAMVRKRGMMISQLSQTPRRGAWIIKLAFVMLSINPPTQVNPSINNDDTTKVMVLDEDSTKYSNDIHELDPGHLSFQVTSKLNMKIRKFKILHQPIFFLL